MRSRALAPLSCLVNREFVRAAATGRIRFPALWMPLSMRPSFRKADMPFQWLRMQAGFPPKRDFGECGFICLRSHARNTAAKGLVLVFRTARRASRGSPRASCHKPDRFRPSEALWLACKSGNQLGFICLTRQRHAAAQVSISRFTGQPSLPPPRAVAAIPAAKMFFAAFISAFASWPQATHWKPACDFLEALYDFESHQRYDNSGNSQHRCDSPSITTSHFACQVVQRFAQLRNRGAHFIPRLGMQLAHLSH